MHTNRFYKVALDYLVINYPILIVYKRNEGRNTLYQLRKLHDVRIERTNIAS